MTCYLQIKPAIINKWINCYLGRGREVKSVIKKESHSKILMAASLLCIGVAAVGALGTDIYLASTQWILMAILFAVYSLWVR